MTAVSTVPATGSSRLPTWAFGLGIAAIAARVLFPVIERLLATSHTFNYTEAVAYAMGWPLAFGILQLLVALAAVVAGALGLRHSTGGARSPRAAFALAAGCAVAVMTLLSSPILIAVSNGLRVF